MAERSKALVLGTSLLGGVGSNPTPINLPFFFLLIKGKTLFWRWRNMNALVLSRLAQLVERKTLNLVVVGSSPTVGVPFCSAQNINNFFFPQNENSKNSPTGN